MSENLIRQRTPPEIKWLANELAATRGEVERLDAEIARLQERKKHLLASYAAMSHVAGQLGALDLPQRVPSVQAHDGRYGGRGRLCTWLKETLKAAQPQAIDTLVLLELASQEFGLTFSTSQARTRFNDNVFRRQLKRLVEQGMFERVEVAGLSKVGWRWRDEVPTMEGLRAQEQAARASVARDMEGD